MRPYLPFLARARRLRLCAELGRAPNRLKCDHCCRPRVTPAHRPVIQEGTGLRQGRRQERKLDFWVTLMVESRRRRDFRPDWSHILPASLQNASREHTIFLRRANSFSKLKTLARAARQYFHSGPTISLCTREAICPLHSAKALDFGQDAGSSGGDEYGTYVLVCRRQS